MPVKVVDLDLRDGADVALASSRYERLRLLVRDGGFPCGYLDVANDAVALERHALLRAIAESWLGSLVWARRALDAVPAIMQPDEPTDPLPVSVVVCTRDRPLELAECLGALREQLHRAYEVLVVDNGSRDGSTRAVVERAGFRYVWEPRPGLNIARDTGWRCARHAIVAYTDDDARPDPGWLSAVATGFAVPDVLATTGLIVPAELETHAQLLFEDAYGGMGKGFVLRVDSRRGRDLTYFPFRYGAGCNMAFRRSFLEATGGFDPALDVGTPTAGGGDLDMLQRVLEADGAICYRPDAVVRHVHRRTYRGLERQLFNNGRGYVAFVAATLARAPRGERIAVLRASVVWASWLFRRIWRRLRKREPLPLQLCLVELAGAAVGPWTYMLSRRRAKRLVAAAAEAPAP